MYLTPNAPLKLQYSVPDLGILYFFLCPKIEEYEDGVAAGD